MEQTQHVPVMMDAVMDYLALEQGMTVVDATLGGGGYTREIYRRVMPGGTVIACDRDKSAIARFQKQYPDIAHNIHIVHSNYSHIRKVLQTMHIAHVDRIVADLGLSSDQLAETDRGFSFSRDAQIDMRMDRTASGDARHVVNTFSCDELTHILRAYGDERYARRIAQAICTHRPIISTTQLADVVCGAVPRAAQNNMHVHPATKTFQAIRIAVNDEYAHLKTFLTEGIDLLQHSGKFVVVSFHSGEDRIVKNIFRAHARGCICDVDMPICQCGHTPQVRVVTKKAVRPSEEETTCNPRSRSARLRCVTKI